MEKKLTSMFEFRKFAPNPRLAKLIAETEDHYAQALDDDDLWMVNAAGVPENFIPEEFQNKGKED